MIRQQRDSTEDATGNIKERPNGAGLKEVIEAGVRSHTPDEEQWPTQYIDQRKGQEQQGGKHNNNYFISEKV
jgi:hypothetical protein